MLPPMVIFQGKGLYRDWFDADDDYADQNAIFAHSDKGFTTNDLATQWLSYFDTWTRDAANSQQCLLILDGRRTHYSPDFIRYAVQNKITFLSYPGHTTYLLQPLDVSVYTPKNDQLLPSLEADITARWKAGSQITFLFLNNPKGLGAVQLIGRTKLSRLTASASCAKKINQHLDTFVQCYMAANRNPTGACARCNPSEKVNIVDDLHTPKPNTNFKHA